MQVLHSLEIGQRTCLGDQNLGSAVTGGRELGPGQLKSPRVLLLLLQPLSCLVEGEFGPAEVVVGPDDAVGEEEAVGGAVDAVGVPVQQVGVVEEAAGVAESCPPLAAASTVRFAGPEPVPA